MHGIPPIIPPPQDAPSARLGNSFSHLPGTLSFAPAQTKPLRKTVGVDPEICACGARMIVDDEVTDGAEIAETLARLGIQSTGPPKRRQSTGELDYLYEV